MGTLFWIFLLLFCGAPANAQDKPRPAVPPGLREAEKHQIQSEPPLPPKRNLDLVRLQREADELAKLAQAIPADVEDVNKGTLPKDLNGKLKRIEKLCKQLRSRRCGIVNSDGSEPPRRKGLRNEWSPRWAPDGHAVAFLPEGEVASDKIHRRSDRSGYSRLGNHSPVAALYGQRL